ncbi:MAG TPA: hypothetical protein VK899_10760 [Gemmatimonadales bacterium]|nr:hypothetical protein [Gemmatimonadales bacterium]
MKYYFASRYSDHPRMRDYRAQLLAAQPGSEVTSRWIDIGRGELVHSYTQQTLREDTAQIWALAGQSDVDDLYAADVVVSFGHQDGGGKGGRHVEFGMAMAWGKRLVLIGTREHLFHTAPQVEHYDTFDDFMRGLP